MRFIPSLVLPLVLVAAAVPLSAGEAPGEFPVTIHERVLDNGLKVLVLPRKGVPAVSCAIAYDVGSVNERAGQTGMAHYLEHMMFKGTRRTGVKDLPLDARYRDALDTLMAERVRLQDAPQAPETVARLAELDAQRAELIDEQKQNLEINHVFTIYREAGSTFTNAMTGNDWTTYIAALPPEKVELFFWVESDRLQNCIFRQFHAEKDVVREERRMYENRPGALFREAVQQAIFGSHPYAHPILGYHDDLRRLTRGELRAFFDTYYAPDNAVLLVGGDVDPEAIFALAEQYFGSIEPAHTKRPRVPVLPIPRSGEIRMHGQGAGESAFDLYYRVPAAGTDQALPLRFLASYLGDEEGGLFRDLVDRQNLAVSFDVDYDARKFGGVLHFSARLSETGTHRAVEARIAEALKAVRAAPPSDEVMERLRRRYRARVLGSVRNEMRIGFMILRREMAGSWRDIERDLQQAKSLSGSALRDLARTYLVPENAVVALYTQGAEPETQGAAVAPLPGHLAASSETAPHAGPPLERPSSWTDLAYEERPFELPSASDARRVLSNGIRAFVVPNEGDPVVRVAAQVLGGAAEDPVGKEGLSQIAATLLGEAGIPGLSPEAFKEHLDGLVASVSTSSDLDARTVSISVFPADLDEGLRILRLLLAEPDLDPTAFARIKEALVSRLAAQERRLGRVTSRLYRDLLWGAVPETRRPTRESVAAITLDDVRALLAESTGPERIVLAVSGDLEVDGLTARLEQALGSWTPAGVRPLARPATTNDPASAARGLHVRAMPASQGSVRIGVPTVPATHADAPALQVLASVLARRTFNTIRSVHGLAYQASARFAPSWRNGSLFTVLFQTKCGSVPFAIDLARQEIATLVAEGPSEAEVRDAKGSLDAGFRRSMGTGFAAAEAFAGLEGRGAPLDHYSKVRQAYAAVDAASVREAAARYLEPEQLLILCVGDVEAMRAGDGQHPNVLADIGEPTVHEAPAPAAATGPEALVERLLTALRESDVEALQAEASTAMRARLQAAPDLAARLGSLFQSAEIAAPEITGAGDEREARVPIEATRNGTTMRLVMRLGLVKEDGAWRCDTFQMGR